MRHNFLSSGSMEKYIVAEGFPYLQWVNSTQKIPFAEKVSKYFDICIHDSLYVSHFSSWWQLWPISKTLAKLRGTTKGNSF